MAKLGRPGLVVAKGDTYGRLTVIKELPAKYSPSGKHLGRMFRCKCECGNSTEVLLSNLRKRNRPTSSCGCLAKESARTLLTAMNTKHGYARSYIYGIYDAMKQRCYNTNCPSYKDYGGRGIKVCKAWLKNPMAFIDWAHANGYSRKLQLDRKNNNGNYTPSNCRFVPRKVNHMNRRCTLYIRYKGKRIQLHTAWEKFAVKGLTYDNAMYRYDAGWTGDAIIDTPVKKRAQYVEIIG